MREIRFLAPADAELAEAVEYYNAESEGLGFAFAGEVRRAVGRIVENPTAWGPDLATIRRCRTNRFPYGVLYQVREDDILIVAVMHLRRHPSTWRKRLGRAER